MSRSGAMFAVAMLLPVAAAAQGTKISATIVCSPPAVLHALPVEGRPDNAYSVSQVKCTPTKPWQIAGLEGKDGVGTGTAANSGTAAQNSGTYVETMANGDKAYYKYEFSSVVKDGKVEKISNHKWELVGGTGKLNAVKGHGSCNAAVQADGKVVYDCQGEYK